METTIQVTTCPVDASLWTGHFYIYPFGMNEKLRVEYELTCECECEQKHVDQEVGNWYCRVIVFMFQQRSNIICACGVNNCSTVRCVVNTGRTSAQAALVMMDTTGRCVSAMRPYRTMIIRVECKTNCLIYITIVKDTNS